MSRTEDPMPWTELRSERRLRILKQAFRCCLAGDVLCLGLIGMSSRFPKRVGIEIMGFSVLAALALLLLAMLFRLWHAFRSLAIESEQAQTTGIAIVQRAEEMGRQWRWAIALCQLPRWPRNSVTALRTLKRTDPR